MIENKLFAGGGLNQDVDENFLKPNEWEYALNIRNTDRQEFSDGVISNVKGNTLVTFTLPAGTNKCIGNYANEQTGLYYSFIWNSGGFHTITEYNPKTGTITKVLQSKTDTDNVDILKFQQYELINGVGIIDGTLLYWTDGYNQPRGIDITKAKTSTYYKDEFSICLVKQPPLDIIQCQYADDPSTSTASNRLKEQLFQFRYLYIYEDNSRSAWSSCSEVPLPNLEIVSSVDTAAYRNNHIDLQFNVGSKYVKSIEIAGLVKGVGATGTTQDWFSILTIDRATAIASPSYSYNALNNSARFSFYNDGLYQSVDIREVDLQFDYVPLKSKTLEIVNGNVLVLGNNTEGYDNIAVNATITTSYTPSQTADRLALGAETGGTQSTQEFTAIFTGVPVENDQVSWSAYYKDRDEGTPVTVSGTYTVSAGNSGSITQVADALGNQIQSTSNVYWNYLGYELVPGGVKMLFDTSVEFPDLTTLNMLSVTLTPTFSNSVATYKTNSKYQFGLVYYDEFNRSTYVQTDESLIIATSSWGAVSGASPKFNWVINHSAPTWATKYQWVRTEQLTHKEFLFWAASSVTANPLNADLYDLNINSLSAYNKDNPNSILGYEYSAGDRCTVHKNGALWINNYDVSVVGFNPATNILTIQKKGGVTLNTAPSVTLLEIYTPKTRANSSTDQFFYEFGEVYSCSGGVHSVSAGEFTRGDIYTKNRPINGATYNLEDPNYSDFYVSNFSSNGRTNIFAPQAKQLNLPTDIRYSDTYVPNTNINGLNRFYGDAYETYDRVNGSIQKLAIRDNYLITFQELKTGYIPVEQSIIEDQGVGNTANVAISSKLLNKIRYFGGDFGIGKNPESFARFAGTMYFTDPNRNVILKLTGGLEPISMNGMDSYFTTKISYTNTIANAKMIGSYDPRNDEFIISFTYPSGTNQETVAYNELSNRWTTFYSFIPDNGGYIFNQYITYKNGAMYTHNTNNTYGSFYGVTYPSEVTIVYNQSPLQIKSFLALMEQANTPWAPTVISTNLGQASSLAATDATLKEGVYFLNFLRDSNSPGGLLNGDDLKGNWIKMKLSESDTTKVQLLSVDVRHIPSYQGIK